MLQKSLKEGEEWFANQGSTSFIEFRLAESEWPTGTGEAPAPLVRLRHATLNRQPRSDIIINSRMLTRAAIVYGVLRGVDAGGPCGVGTWLVFVMRRGCFPPNTPVSCSGRDGRDGISKTVDHSCDINTYRSNPAKKRLALACDMWSCTYCGSVGWLTKGGDDCHGNRQKAFNKTSECFHCALIFSYSFPKPIWLRIFYFLRVSIKRIPLPLS